MTRGGKPGPVVVGVDRAGSANDTLDWATAEAAARDCSLRIAHVFRSPLATDAYGLAMPIDSVTRTHTAAQLVLQAAVARARSSSTRLGGVGTTAHGDDCTGPARPSPGRAAARPGRARPIRRACPAGRVDHRSCRQALPLPGRRHSCRRQRARRLALRAVDPARRRSVDSAPSDPSSSGPAAISFAFHAARQRGIPLTALSAWTPDPPADFETIPGSPRTAEGAARRALEQALTRWREEFPTVPVITKLVCADPVDALIATSSGAALLVVGSARRGPLRRMIFGSVTRSVLRDARCPVAIVSRNRTTSGRTRAERTGGERRGVWESGPIDRVGRERFWFRRASR